MSVSVRSNWLMLGVWGLVITLLLSIFGEEAEAARRRGRGGVRRPAPRMKKAGGKARKGGGGRRAVRKAGNGGGRNLAVLPANVGAANAVNNNLLQDFGPASAAPNSNFNQLVLGNQGVGNNGFNGLAPINGLSNLGRTADGRIFELNSGSVVNGAFAVDPNLAVRQQILDLNGSLIAGQNGSLLPGTSVQLQQFNAGVIPAGSGIVVGNIGIGSAGFGGVNQVRSLRRF